MSDLTVTVMLSCKQVIIPTPQLSKVCPTGLKEHLSCGLFWLKPKFSPEKLTVLALSTVLNLLLPVVGSISDLIPFYSGFSERKTHVVCVKDVMQRVFGPMKHLLNNWSFKINTKTTRTVTFSG